MFCELRHSQESYKEHLQKAVGPFQVGSGRKGD